MILNAHPGSDRKMMPEDQSTLEGRGCLVYVGPPFVPNAQPGETEWLHFVPDWAGGITFPASECRGTKRRDLVRHRVLRSAAKCPKRRRP
jgi:hypothetical protein